MVESAFHPQTPPTAIKDYSQSKMNRTEAMRFMQKAISTSSTSGGSNTARNGSSTARSGTNTARGQKSARASARGARDTSPTSTRIIKAPSPGSPTHVSDTMSLLRLRQEFADKLEIEKMAFRKREQDLEEQVRRAEKLAQRDAINETNRGLTRLRQQQHRQLRAQHKMHEHAESEKMAAAARALQMAAQQREELQRTQQKTKAEVEAKASSKQKQLEDRHEEAMRRLRETLNTAFERKLEQANELKRRETLRAESLQKELEAAKADARAVHSLIERTKREKDVALREAASKAQTEKRAAIQAEKAMAETSRRTALQAEAIRAEAVNKRSQQADEITALATNAIKVAEAERAKAEKQIREAEAERERLTLLHEEAEAIREEGRLKLERAEKMIADAEGRVATMDHAMNVQKAALDAVKQSADAEKVALMKAAEEAKAAALLAVAEERAAEKAAAEAEKAAAEASAAIAKKLGVASSAIAAPPADWPTPPPKGAPSGQSQGEAAASPGASATPADLEAMSKQIEAALASASEQHKLSLAAEEHAADLDQKLTALSMELKSAKDAHAKDVAELTARSKSALAAAETELQNALRRLRSAHRSMIDVPDLSEIDRKRALAIAGCDVESTHMTDASSILELSEQKGNKRLQVPAYIGVVGGIRLSKALSNTAGFGTAGKAVGKPEVVHISFGHLNATGVATLPGGKKAGARGEWVIKYVVDEDQVGPSAYGEMGVTISTLEGIVLIKGAIHVRERPKGMQSTKRYEYDSSNAAITKVQARSRGKKVRDEQKVEKELAKQAQVKKDKAATKLQSLQRGKLSRQETADRLAPPPEADPQVYIVATRKPLILRAGADVGSDKVGEIAQDTRVLVVSIEKMADGSERAQVQREHEEQPCGWLTSSKDGMTSLSPVEAQA